ncbi:hypothetical protein N7493_000848 [Penicillium malachiteum]|uniref:Enoyl reductase (ER) domain-containing protein n=1 Tax=Penicillium malachiteum TaxID=1324776 RepID=A0AAD6HXP7_9EURO|nr:hypothetical protein N7493_000848 [Penicillium malachiteum]
MTFVESAQLPPFQTAVVAQGPGKLSVQHNVPIPTLTSDMVLVKTAAVAINPADAKMLDYSAAPGAIHGYDFSGTIVAVGDSSLSLAVGDRVAGFVHGMNILQPGVGAFAEYVGASADILLKIPDSLSFEKAATLGVGVGTAALGLFHELRVPASLQQLKEANADVDTLKGDSEFVLVAGGSTATGTRAIQLLKLAGLRPIATCSPAHFDLAYKFGAEKVFDYHSADCGSDIRTYTRGNLAYALDCVSQADTTELCYQAIGRAGGRYVSLEPFRTAITQTRPTVEPSWLMVLSLFGRQVALDGDYGRPARPDHRKFGATAFSAVQALLDRNLIDPHPSKIMPGQWDGVIEGVSIIRSQAPSGVKLVYSVESA